MKFKRSIQKLWSDIHFERATPHQIASGFTLGSAAALLPTFGFSVLIVVLFLIFFPKVNKPAAFFAIAVWNPIVQIPIYSISFGIGSFFFGDLPVVRYDIEILNQIFTLSRRLIVGNLIMTTLLSALSYFIVYFVSLNYFGSNSSTTGPGAPEIH